MCDPWTAERVSLLKQLWASGATAKAIGAQLGGLSRSAVLGKIYRLRRAEPASAPKPRPTRRRSKQSEVLPAAPSCEPKRLLDLTNNSCRWPIAGPARRAIFFCGAPEADLAGGMPYCAYHARRAYVIPPKRVAAPARQQSEAASPARRYVWRTSVRHSAPRFR
jgi:GcrA cell cycle regulator